MILMISTAKACRQVIVNRDHSKAIMTYDAILPPTHLLVMLIIDQTYIRKMKPTVLPVISEPNAMCSLSECCSLTMFCHPPTACLRR